MCVEYYYFSGGFVAMVDIIRKDPLLLTIIGAIVAGLIVAFITFVTREIFTKLKINRGNNKKNLRWITPEPKPLIDKTEMFGSKRNFTPLWKKIDTSKKQNVYITGLPGAGTSFISKVLAYELQTKYAHIGYFDCGSFNKPLNFALSICRVHKTNTFKGDKVNRFLSWLKNLDGLTILFFDNIRKGEQLEDIIKLFPFDNVTVVIATSIMSWEFNDNIVIKHEVKPLSHNESVELFHKSVETNFKKYNVGKMLAYSYNLPFLVKAIAQAVDSDRNLMDNLFYRVPAISLIPDKISHIDAKNYKNQSETAFNRKMKELLAILYNVNGLQPEQRHNLGKISVFYPHEFTYLFFKWFGIDEKVCSNLRIHRWLKSVTDETGNSIYYMPEIIYLVINHLSFSNELKDILFQSKKFFDNDEGRKHFQNFKMYAEKLFDLVNESRLVNTKEWGEFALAMAQGYDLHIYDCDMALCWLDSYDTNNLEVGNYLKYLYAYVRFRIYSVNCGRKLLEDIVTSDYVYALAQKAQDAYDEYKLNKSGQVEMFEPFEMYGLKIKTELNSDLENQLLLFMENNIELSQLSKYTETIFQDDKLPKDTRIISLYCYISAHINNNRLDTIKTVVEGCPFELLEENSRQCSWLCLSLKRAYDIWNDSEKSKEFLEKGVIKSNLCEGFGNEYLRRKLSGYEEFTVNGKFSESKFAEYMQSTSQLIQNTNDCIHQINPDSEALYILGRYHENHNEMDRAINYYSKARSMENVRASCALGYLYYSGKGLEKDIVEAEKLWLFGRNRKHGGSCRWLYELYKDKDEEIAKKFILEAIEFGSNTAQKILKTLDTPAA